MCVWRGRAGRKDALRENLIALFIFEAVWTYREESGRRKWVCVCVCVCVGWMGKSGREDSVKQLLELSVNWSELCPVI